VHLGVETQRQWSDLAIARTTPCLLGLFSLISLLAAQLRPSECKAAASSAWYRKERRKRRDVGTLRPGLSL
jgi:hypothetical protein